MFSFARLATLLSVTATLFAPQPSRAFSMQRRQQQDPNTPLYLNEPSCGSYQCTINLYPGNRTTANWLNPPAGDVVLDLLTDDSSKVAFNIGTVPGTTNDCDAGQGPGVAVNGVECGAYSWIVATEWVGGNYTLRAMSKDQPDIESYTDVILVKADPANTASVPFSGIGASPTGDSSSSASATGTASSQNGTASGASATSAAPSSSSSNSSSSNQGDAVSMIGSAKALFAGSLAAFFAATAILL